MEKSDVPGRNIISVPKNPNATQIDRKNPIFSLRKGIDRTQTING